MRNILSVICGVLAVSLFGCNIHSWNVEEAEKTCKDSYRMEPGTEAYSFCVMKVTEQITNRNINSQMMMSNTLNDMQFQRTLPPTPNSVRCSPAPSTTNNNSNPPVYNCQ